MPPIKVLVADDHPLFSKAILDILSHEEDIQCVATARNGLEAVELAKQFNPNIALIDIDMPIMTGIEAARKIKNLSLETAVIILSAFDYDEYVSACIEYKLEGYLLKTIEPSDLVWAIRLVCSGESIFDQSVIKKARNKFNDKKQRELSSPLLHPRELEVLALISSGMTNKQVSSELGIAVSTVTSHVMNIFRKLGVQSRTEAAFFAIKNGLLSVEKHEKATD